ncbi:MAG: hypothetical protein K2J71_08455 [Oscillospiraceae bacterium]|nr:hypothetical protein [Oscillospiraceae bacterium]
MHRTKIQNRENFRLHGSSISAMLRSVKGRMSPKQYKELCCQVNQASSYSAKKGLIFASIQAKQKEQKGGT